MESDDGENEGSVSSEKAYEILKDAGLLSDGEVSTVENGSSEKATSNIGHVSRTSSTEKYKKECPSPYQTPSTSSNGSKRIQNVVAHLAHTRLEDYSKVTFQARLNPQSGKKAIFSMKDQSFDNENIVYLGKEDDDSPDGFDYAIAVVDNITKEYELYPATLVTFSAVYTKQPEVLLGLRSSTEVNFTNDYSEKKETWAEKKAALTSEFGSAKMMKLQDAVKRRQIKEDTLTIMMNSAFASPNVIKREYPTDTKESISLLHQAHSSILPAIKQGATLPSDLYPLSLFISDEEISNLKDTAKEFIEKSKEEVLGESNYGRLIFRYLGSFEGSPERICYMLLLASMIKLYKLVGRASKKNFYQNDILSMSLPAEFLNKVRRDFFPGEFASEGRSRPKLILSSSDKDRLLSHLLCLGLVLDTSRLSIPITPWSKELMVTENRIIKIATALGCGIVSLSQEEAVRLGSTRMARLKGPPQVNHTPKRPRRR
ncbi:hypothetical protein AB6A40_008887 [Gnathostoma spinigerum]|uniref:Uncharacterized protein n=1 Tax=Gnathostoma spinigerum TaxID=75299 RepID=A0ABD6EQE7_9BILA